MMVEHDLELALRPPDRYDTASEEVQRPSG